MNLLYFDSDNTVSNWVLITRNVRYTHLDLHVCPSWADLSFRINVGPSFMPEPFMLYYQLHIIFPLAVSLLGIYEDIETSSGGKFSPFPLCIFASDWVTQGNTFWTGAEWTPLLSIYSFLIYLVLPSLQHDSHFFSQPCRPSHTPAVVMVDWVQRTCRWHTGLTPMKWGVNKQETFFFNSTADTSIWTKHVGYASIM